MRKRHLIDVFQLELYVPRDLPTKAGNAARRDLDSRRFRDRLRRAIQGVVKEFAGLQTVQVRIKL